MEEEYEEIIKNIASYCARHLGATYEVGFSDGDSYLCKFANSEYEDNDEELDSPAYEEWYVVDFKVVDILKDGPNRDPRFEYITVSRKRMPSFVTREGEVVYQAG